MSKPLIPLLFLAVLTALPAAGARLLSTSPQVTELLFQLGKGSDIVATPDFSDYPQAARSVPRLGPLFFPNFERAFVLRPDRVVTDASLPLPYFEAAVRSRKMRRFHFTVSDARSLLDESSRFLREVYGEETTPVLERAEHCLSAAQKNRVRKGTGLAFVWMDPPVLVGAKTFLSSIIELSGYSSITPAEWPGDFPRVSEEWLLARSVDTVWSLVHASDEATRSRVEARVRALWPRRPPRVRFLDQDRFARASLTPLRHLSDLGVESPPEECRGLGL